MSKKNGLNVPIFSLRSHLSGGIGEYLDLIPLMDWMKKRGFNLLQLLPINDSGQDPSPYNALSAFALNPMYIRYEGFDAKDLNTLARVPYKAICELKERHLLESVVPNFDRSFLKTFIKNYPWIHNYAKFKALKKKYYNLSWYDWPSDETIDEELVPYFIEQYLAYQQFSKVKQHAESLGIEILGDIPILISPDSTAVWENPGLFNLDLRAGAPPDQYNSEGQYWGFPLYRWDEMEKTNFDWWNRRLKNASECFHSYRIDHIVGFYRMWAMKEGQKPTEGSFYPADRNLWIPQGEKLLQMMLNATLMRPVGEDLGVIPDEVRASMAFLAIPGTKVIRWERNWKENGEFIPYDQYPELSLTCVSTHDSEPLKLWWQRQPEEVQAFCKFKGWIKTTELFPNMIKSILYDSHHTNSRMAVNLLPEYLSVVPELTYDNPEQDRINVPGTVTEKNWTYRIKPFIEEMTSNQELNDAIEEILNP